MNFKDLREADLSKAQINKVHDKADDLPKSDFIKRYGKEGDAVRFATATNMVKKQLGIAEAAKPNRRGTEINVLELTFSNSGDAKKAEDWIDSSAWSSLVVDYEQSRNTVYMQGVTDPGGNVSPRGPGLQGALKAAGFKFRVTEEDTSDYDEADYDEANEGRIMGISRLNPSYKEGEKAAKKGIKYDKNPYSQSTPGFKRLNWSSGHNAFRATQLSKAGKPNYGARGQFEELDKEDEKSIGDVIKGLKKAVKAHQGQVDALTKDIKDEVEVTEARAKMPSDNNIKKKHGNATPMKSYKQGFDAANKGKKITTNPHKSMFGFDRGAWNKGFTDADQGFNIKTFSQNDYDDKGVMKKEEVVTEAVSAALVNQISRMTDRNNHFGVRIELARIAGDKELMRYYDSLEKMHNKLGGVIGNSAIEVRQKLESVLKNRLQRKFNDKDADRLMGAL